MLLLCFSRIVSSGGTYSHWSILWTFIYPHYLNLWSFPRISSIFSRRMIYRIGLSLVALQLQTHSSSGYRPQGFNPAIAHPHIPVKEVAGRITVTRYELEFIVKTKSAIGICDYPMLIWTIYIFQIVTPKDFRQSAVDAQGFQAGVTISSTAIPISAGMSKPISSLVSLWIAFMR